MIYTMIFRLKRLKKLIYKILKKIVIFHFEILNFEFFSMFGSIIFV